MWGTTINSPTVKPSTLVQHPTTPLYTHQPSMPITTFRTFTFRTIARVPYPALLSRTFIPRAVLPTLATPSRVAAPYRAYTHAHDVPVRPMIQKPAPKWSAKAVVNGEFQHVSLDDYKGKFLVMVFYPADFTFVCPTELIAFSDRSADFNKLGAQVVGISVDNAHSHLAWVNTPRKQGGLGRMEIPLVSDITKEIAAKYDVLIKEDGIALRGLFIIDPHGILRVSHVHDLPIGRSVDETLRVIEAIQFADEYAGKDGEMTRDLTCHFGEQFTTHVSHCSLSFPPSLGPANQPNLPHTATTLRHLNFAPFILTGEVCPANWHKGDATIKPNHKESHEYFSKVAEARLRLLFWISDLEHDRMDGRRSGKCGLGYGIRLINARIGARSKSGYN
ncbi:thioredoxin-like protein [Jimgerdemannia flammicorona]|uniref:Thioredoxin-like protein n=1 Tax=Jimgerdemannia flammicorona TaxID=994334 RepID=A0A433Q8Y1_9FUNG|nr:thioredoxin-like protein [Jimgerdemannia flammicorona]